jgi:hypothetical protein
VVKKMVSQEEKLLSMLKKGLERVVGREKYSHLSQEDPYCYIGTWLLLSNDSMLIKDIDTVKNVFYTKVDWSLEVPNTSYDPISCSRGHYRMKKRGEIDDENIDTFERYEKAKGCMNTYIVGNK